MSASHFLGFDIGGTKCAVCLGDFEGNPIDSVKFQTEKGFLPVWERLRSVTRELLSRNSLGMGDIAASGISCGGPLDSIRGIVQSPPNLPGWDNIPICDIVKNEFSIPCFLMNDANACALAEWRLGAGRACRNMIFITMGTGFGAGLIIDGKLYEGASGMAGEIGHVRLSEEGHEAYGKKGSWEAFCGGNGIALYAERLGKDFCKPEELDEYFNAADSKNFSVKSLGAAAKKGNRFALEIFSRVGERLGYGLAILLDIINPERIVIGSIFERCENFIRPSMERSMGFEALPQCFSACKIVPAALGDRIGDCACLLVARNGIERNTGK